SRRTSSTGIGRRPRMADSHGRTAGASTTGGNELMPRGRAIACAVAIALTGCATKTFDLQGHRGARGLAPENTLPAFATALSLGVTPLELDTAITKDDVVVVSHDPFLNPDIVRGPDGAFLR